MMALTKVQRELLGFIRAWQEDQGTSPSFDEMREALGLRSKSGIHRLVLGLEERGFIRRLKNKARAIEIIEEPHLPDRLADVSDIKLAREAKRRGLALCHIYKEAGRKHFMELSA